MSRPIDVMKRIRKLCRLGALIVEPPIVKQPRVAALSVRRIDQILVVHVRNDFQRVSTKHLGPLSQGNVAVHGRQELALRLMGYEQ